MEKISKMPKDPNFKPEQITEEEFNSVKTPREGQGDPS
jgi:hypothetical protein